MQSDINALPFIVLSVGSERGMACAVFSRAQTRVTHGGRVVHYVLQTAPEEAFARLCVPGAQCGGLFVDLRQRQRYRINGRVGQFVDGVLSVDVSEALPNCPKYIQARVPEAPFPTGKRRLRAVAAALSAEQMQWVAQCDTFFLGTCFGRADATHRGGWPGFVRVLSGTELRWGEYQGNNMNMTLGNLAKCGAVAIAVPHWSGGGALHVRGTARIDYETHLDGSAVTVTLAVTEVEELERSLASPFRLLDRSPHNPPLQEAGTAESLAKEATVVRLREIIVESPLVKSFIFEGAVNASPGQHGLFELPLGIGPRTWTVTHAGPGEIGITVKLDRALSRGGSRFLHERAALGTRVLLRAVENGPFAAVPPRTLFLTAGIGLTPAIAAVRKAGSGAVSVLHFDSAPAAEVPRWQEVAAKAKQARLCTQPNRAQLTAELLRQFDFDRVFLCGPQRFMAAATAVLKQMGITPVTENFSY